jgi:hypothetical protein
MVTGDRKFSLRTDYRLLSNTVWRGGLLPFGDFGRIRSGTGQVSGRARGLYLNRHQPGLDGQTVVVAKWFDLQGFGHYILTGGVPGLEVREGSRPVPSFQ